MKSNFFSVIALCLTLATLSNCSKEKDDNTMELLIATWILTSHTIDGNEQLANDCEKRHNIDLKPQNLCTLYNGCTQLSSSSGWSYKNEMLNIAVHLPAAYFIESIDKNSLILGRYDITSQGELQLSIFSYRKNN